MMAEGYKVELARSAREVLELIIDHEHLDLLILDPDLPDAGELDILEKLQKRLPTLPVVVHTFLSEYVNQSFVSSSLVFVEKEGSNIDRLKKVVNEVLRKFYPGRWDSKEKERQPQAEYSFG
jgi:DNA-binding NtrC family response regulator